MPSSSRPDASTPDLPVSADTPARQAESSAGRWVVLALYVLIIGGLVLAWRHPYLNQWMSVDALAALGRRIQAWPMAPLIIVGCYVAAVGLGLPVTILVTVAAIVFGPWWGMVYAMTGMLAGALVIYSVGRLSGEFVDRVAGRRMQAIAQGLRTHGLPAVIFVRVMPVAPFVLVNLACGALRVRLPDYVLGSFIGLLPATVLFCLFTDRLTAAVRAPSASTVAALVAFVLLALGLSVYLKKRSQARQLPG